MARGAYIHSVLEELLRELGESVVPQTLARAEQLLPALLAARQTPVAFGASAPVRAAAVRAVEADLRRYLREEARSGGHWRVAALEQRFGFDDEVASLPELRLGDGAAAVRLRGVIDRVDVEPGGRRAVVRDYKSGSQSPRFALARWREDRQLQVALYVLVVRELMGLEPVAGIYQPLSGRELRPRGLVADDAPPFASVYDTDRRDQAGFDAELEDAAARAIALAAALRAGELSPAPDTCSRFGCAHPGICRSG
jgi:RecB family exonuclease